MGNLPAFLTSFRLLCVSCSELWCNDHALPTDASGDFHSIYTQTIAGGLQNTSVNQLDKVSVGM